MSILYINVGIGRNPGRMDAQHDRVASLFTHVGGVARL